MFRLSDLAVSLRAGLAAPMAAVAPSGKAAQASLLHAGKPSLSEFEKHLDDYHKGRGNWSLSTAEKLRGVELENAQLLSATAPKLSSLYLHYRTAMDYEAAAGYEYALSSAFEGCRGVHEAQNERSAAETQGLIGRYAAPLAAVQSAVEKTA